MQPRQVGLARDRARWGHLTSWAATGPTPLDRLTVESGRWVRAPGEIVLSQRLADGSGLGVGDRVTAGHSSLVIVGIAASVTPDAEAWVAPQQIHALVGPQAPLHYLMLYRVNPAGSAQDLRNATQAIAASLPLGALENNNNYLDVKHRA